MNPNGQPQPPKKLVDFNDELKALCVKYQFELRVVHVYDQFQGHQAIIQAFDVSPKDAGVPLNGTPDPTPATPVDPTPPTPPAEPVPTAPPPPAVDPAVDQTDRPDAQPDVSQTAAKKNALDLESQATASPSPEKVEQPAAPTVDNTPKS